MHPTIKDLRSRHRAGVAPSGLILRRLVCLFGLTMVDLSSTDAAPPFTAAAFSPDGTQVVLGSQAGLEIRSWPALEPAGALATDLDQILDLRFSPDGETLLIAGGSPAEAGSVAVMNWTDRQIVRRIAAHTDVVYRVAWSPTGTQWATAGGDGVCQVHSADTGERLTRYKGHSRSVLSLVYLPEGQTIVSAGVDQTLRLWSANSAEERRTLDNHVGTVNAVAARPTGGTKAPPIVASASEDRTVRLWQPTLGRLMRFARLPSIPRVLAWSNDGSRIYVGCNDGQVRVLDPDTVEVLTTLDGLNGRIHELLIDPTANRLFIAGEGGCRQVLVPD